MPMWKSSFFMICIWKAVAWHSLSKLRSALAYSRFCLLSVCLLSVGCHYPKPDYSDEWDLTEKRKDSLDFEASRHYGLNYNFMVVADSLCLLPARPVRNPGQVGEPEDTAVVFADDRLVVAEVTARTDDPEDYVWVKVARDQSTMGWVREQDLLARVVPDNPVSRFIHAFGNTRLICLLSVLGALSVLCSVRRMRPGRFHIVHLDKSLSPGRDKQAPLCARLLAIFDDIGSCYPTLLCLTVSGSATLYAGMQDFVPDTWTEFYFHPTLNPFGLPFVLGLFVASVWLIVILAIASVDDVLRQLPFREAMPYLLALFGVCAGCYLFFSLTTSCYLGYPFLLFYAGWALRRYFRHARKPYVCGRCGAGLRGKGRCPRCGAWND